MISANQHLDKDVLTTNHSGPLLLLLLLVSHFYHSSIFSTLALPLTLYEYFTLYNCLIHTCSLCFLVDDDDVLVYVCMCVCVCVCWLLLLLAILFLPFFFFFVFVLLAFDDDNNKLLSHKDKVIMLAPKILTSGFFTHTHRHTYKHTYTH